MKKYIISIFTLVFCFTGATSCNEELLDVEPINEYLSENFYQTEDQLFSALIAAYDPLGWSMAYGQWISYVMMGEIRSDNANAGGDASNADQPGWQELDDFTETDVNVVLQPLYRRSYIGIFRANLVIQNGELGSAEAAQYVGEAKFLRAYYHFEAFKNFGPIPVVETVLEPSDVTLPRNTLDEVFESITTDLEEAIAVLPSTISDAEAGRASVGAAEALLGKAYLYWADLDGDDQAKFDLAAEHLSEVVNAGQYQLLDDYEDLFAFGQNNSAESVFEIQHSNLWPSDFQWFEGIEGNGYIQLSGIRGLCADHPLYQPGWGFTLPTASLYNHYLADDTYRREASIISVDQLEDDLAAAGASCNVVVDQTEQNQADYTGYWQKKYANFKGYAGNNVNGGDEFLTKDGNTYVIRYADVLLMLAEALHRGSGSDAEAMGYIDQVRARAAGPEAATFTSTSELLGQAGFSTLLDVIWYERRAELALEGDRWYDLVRSGRVESNLFEAGKAANVSEQKRFLPISFEETSVANGLTTYPDESLF